MDCHFGAVKTTCCGDMTLWAQESLCVYDVACENYNQFNMTYKQMGARHFEADFT